MRKPAFCICENKAADQLRGNREADQRLCFRYLDSTIRLLPKSEFSSLSPSSVAVQPGLCGTWSETPNTGFLTTRLKWEQHREPQHKYRLRTVSYFNTGGLRRLRSVYRVTNLTSSWMLNKSPRK